ncbi:MAG: HEAT repeat domain-containing protein, partial [Planctomycetales bacterium]|nr:HEAT repeat domain-containing protein [Planctomycetales bacterium]
MDRTLQRVCRLAQAGDMELRCAALRVLGELDESGKPVLDVVRAALREGPEALRVYALAAAERLGVMEVLPDILPFLGDRAQVGRKAGEVVAGLGVRALAHLLKGLETARGETRQAMLGVLGGVPGAKAEQALIRSLGDSDAEAVEGAARALSIRLGGLRGPGRRTLGDQVAALLRTRKRLTQEAAGSSLRVLGRVGDPHYRPLLLDFAAPDQPPPVRREALLALAALPAPPHGGDRLMRQLIKYVDEPDFVHVVQPALAAIQQIPTPPSLADSLQKLLDHGSPAARRIAAEKLGEVDRTPRAKALLRYFDDSDTAVREAVSAALGKMVSALAPLLQSLERVEDSEQAWRIVRVLEKQAGKVPTSAARRLLAVGTARVEKGHPTARPLLYLLRAVNPRSFRDTLLGRARQLLKQRKAAAADALCSLLAREDLDSPVSRYEMAVVKLAVSRLDASLPYRETDPALREFTELLRNGGQKVAGRVRTDRALGPQHLLYVGFHFAERGGDERNFGAELLRHVVKRYPRSPEAQVAKNKLLSE